MHLGWSNNVTRGPFGSTRSVDVRSSPPKDAPALTRSVRANGQAMIWLPPVITSVRETKDLSIVEARLISKQCSSRNEDYFANILE